MVYELYLRGLKFAPIDLYESRATHFKVIEVDGEQRLLPPFCTLQGFGETAARDLIRAREEVAKTNETGKFETIEELQKLSGLGKKNIELLRKILLPGFPGTASCGSAVRSDLWICGSHLCSLHGTFRSARSFERGDSSGKNRIYSGRIREYSGSLQYKGKKRKHIILKLLYIRSGKDG